MDPDNYANIIIALITAAGVVLSTALSGVAVFFSRRASRHSQDANRAVNQNAPGSRRLYEIVDESNRYARRSLECSEKNSESIDRLQERLEQVDDRLDTGEDQFKVLFKFLGATSPEANNETEKVGGRSGRASD